VNPGFCEKIEVTRVPPLVVRVPQVGNPWFKPCLVTVLAIMTKQSPNAFMQYSLGTKN